VVVRLFVIMGSACDIGALRDSSRLGPQSGHYGFSPRIGQTMAKRPVTGQG
jgi:hypothetical protein